MSQDVFTKVVVPDLYRVNKNGCFEDRNVVKDTQVKLIITMRLQKVVSFLTVHVQHHVEICRVDL